MSDLKFSDETLMAYVDGELDDAATARIDELLAGDDQLRDRIDLFAQSRDLAAAALGPLAHEDVPAALARSVRAMVDLDARESHSNILAFARAQKNQPKRIWPGWSLASAAAALLLVAGSTGYLVGAGSMSKDIGSDLATISDPAIIKALSEQPSGKPMDVANTGRVIEPIVSFKLEDGTLCREFQLKEPASKGVLSIACLEKDRWQTHLLLASSKPEEGYMPAGAAETVDAYLASIHAGPPLEISEEQNALKALQKVQ